MTLIGFFPGRTAMRAVFPALCVFTLLGSTGNTSAQDAHGAVPNAVGDPSRDLVFTPVPRCRLMDTRLEGGRLSVDVPRHVDVAGSLAGQGGADDCLVPEGAAIAVVRLTPIRPDGTGHVTVWPFGAPADIGTVLRFKAGSRGLQMILPELLLPICNSALGTCTHDLTVQAGGSEVDLVADVTGYFAGVPAFTLRWTDITDQPAGFADGVDNDTQYVAAPGGGLSQSGTQFAVAAGGVNSARIADGAVLDVDISPSAAIAATKVAGTAAVLGFAGTQAFDTNTLVIDAAANAVGLGTSTPLSPLTVATSTEPIDATAQIAHGSGARGLVLKRTANDTGYTNLTFLKSRGDAVTPAVAGDGVGRIFFDVVDGDSTVRPGADVRVDLVALSPTDLETNMAFRVHDGAPTTAPAERLRITPSGISVTGSAVASGPVSAASVTSTGAVNAGSISTGGGVTAGTLTAAGAVTAGSVTATGNVLAMGVTATAKVSAADVEATVVDAGTVAAELVTTEKDVISDRDVMSGRDVIASGDVKASGGVFLLGRLSPPGPAIPAGDVAGIVVDDGCAAPNRGEMRIIESAPSVDWFCVCLAMETNDYRFLCLRP